MSKDKIRDIKSALSLEAEVVQTPASPPVPPPPVPNPRLADMDRMALELAKSKRQTALAEAKTALANNENAELSYKYVVLQLYMKYGLTERDAISENGDIIKDGAVQVPQGR